MRDEGHSFIFLGLCGMDNGKLFADRDEKRPISISALFSIANATKEKNEKARLPISI